MLSQATDIVKIIFASIGSGLMGEPYCGKALQGKTLVSPGNSVRMIFKTDASLALRGVKVEISFVIAGKRTVLISSFTKIYPCHETKTAS